MSDDVLYDAVQYITSELRLRHEIVPELVSACITSGASTPSFRLVFRNWDRPICVERPWRVLDWYHDIDAHNSTCSCERT